MGKALKRKVSVVIQELQLAPLIGSINLFKNQCNLQEFCLTLIAVAYNELHKPLLQDQCNICCCNGWFSSAFLTAQRVTVSDILQACHWHLLQVSELWAMCHSRTMKVIHASNCTQFSGSLALSGCWYLVQNKGHDCACCGLTQVWPM